MYKEAVFLFLNRGPILFIVTGLLAVFVFKGNFVALAIVLKCVSIVQDAPYVRSSGEY